jgi:hypothetical protein
MPSASSNNSLAFDAASTPLSQQNNLAEIETVKHTDSQYNLPEYSQWNYLRFHPTLMPYFRWFVLVVIVNLWLLWDVYVRLAQTSSLELVTFYSYAVLLNFFVAILIRQHYVINLLFWLATRTPLHWPLPIRWAMGKVYHFGGLHTGCACAGTFWFCVLLASMYHFQQQQQIQLSLATLIFSSCILLLLLMMIISALPKIRARKHNQFEIIHRFAGWSVLILFWLQSYSLLLSVHPDKDMLYLLVNSPSLWLLSVLSLSVILPWLRLKKVPVEIVKPSNHVAISKFDYGVTPFAGSSMALSRNPLLEWHSFANIPAPDTSGFRLAISRAGDWTGEFIEQCPSHVWVKGIPTAGVGNVDQLFKKVLWVATGSGIGPCLPHLLSDKVATSLVWSTRDPTKTYGDELVNQILDAQDEVIIWDTDKDGKPDMVDITYQAFRRTNAEAIIVISNKKLTYTVVHAMESRGIPAFGAIWDS